MRSVPWLCLLGLASACRDSGELPEGFVFGTSTAGFQVEMGCPKLGTPPCADTRSDWYAFITSTVTLARSGNFLAGDPPESGPGFYELYEEDLDRVKAMGLTGFRMSIEWSRVFPESTVGTSDHEALRAIASPEGLDYYRRLFAALEARGITPLVTLNHYTLPVWMHDAVGCNRSLDRCSPRGWLEPNIVEEIAKYAGFVAREFGASVDTWATLNEPLAVLIPGYLLPSRDRTNPPAQTLRTREAKMVLSNLIEAHARMVDEVRAADTVDADGDGKAAFVGIVYPIAPFRPLDPSNPIDRIAAKNLFYVYNELFLNAVLLGVLDEALDGQGARREHLADRADFLGLNYYFSVTVKGEESSVLPDFSPLLTFDPFMIDTSGERTDPRGLFDALAFASQNYPGLPIIITENGTFDGPEDRQERFLAEHMSWLLAAQRTLDLDLRGFYWWSLMDNYEWNHGMGLRFGLFRVDPDDRTKTRTARPVQASYQRVVEERGLPSDLADRFPVPAALDLTP